MNRKLIFTLGILFVIGLSIFSMYINSNKREVRLRNLAFGEIEKVEIIHDQMWKTISQEAQVTSEYKEAFDSIYSHIIDGRYSEDNSLFRLIKESNPQFSEDLYKKLMIDIESLREKFSQQQIKVEDIIREHNNLLEDPISGIFVKNTERINYTVISSSRTKKVIEEREDNEVEINF